MARKNVALKQIESAKSLAADFTTEATVIQWLDNVAYQINVTTTNSVGSFIVQASLDYIPSDNPMIDGMANSGNWVDLNLTATPVVNAANDSILIDLNQLPYKAIRLKYVKDTAGTGHCDIFVNARQMGG